MKKFAVIVAAGSGSRMESSIPKQFMELNGRPVLWHTLRTFLDAYADMQIILVLPPDHFEKGLSIVSELHAQQRVRITEGGETRFHSVKNGLSLVDGEAIVFVHDAVRCLVSVELIQRCSEQAAQKGNAIPAVPCVDTIRIDSGKGPEPVDRNRVYAIQTPQTFKAVILKRAFETSYSPSFTDEATVAEASGTTINLVEGETANIKLTRPVDMLVAAAILKSRNKIG